MQFMLKTLCKGYINKNTSVHVCVKTNSYKIIKPLTMYDKYTGCILYSFDFLFSTFFILLIVTNLLRCHYCCIIINMAQFIVAV